MAEQEIALKIRKGNEIIFLAETVIIVPSDAPDYPEKITCFCKGSPANAKHAYYTLSQIALMDFEEHALDMTDLPQGTVISLVKNSLEKSMDAGLVIARDTEGKVSVFAHENVDKYLLLKFANRYCTRWIRLDI